MQVGKRVYVQKDEIQFHRWYKAHITHIRFKTYPISWKSPFRCMWNVFTCYTCSKIEYVVRLQDGTTLTVDRHRLETQL